MSIENLHHIAGRIVTAQYRATRCTERQKLDGQRYQILQLDDVTGSIRAMVWPNAARAIGPLPPMPCFVEVTGRPRWFNDELILDVHQLHRIEADQIASGVLLMPKGICPDIALPALRDLVEFHGLIESPDLRSFVARVLHDEAVVESLLRCPASRRQHHAYPGGLLVHSASPLGLVKTMAEERVGDDPESVEVTQVAYLFHGLGKVVSLRNTPCERMAYLRHGFLTIQILAPHIKWLSARSPRLAAMLSDVFDVIDQPPSTRRRASIAGADVVMWVAQHTASLSAGQQTGVSSVAPRMRQPIAPFWQRRVGY